MSHNFKYRYHSDWHILFETCSPYSVHLSTYHWRLVEKVSAVITSNLSFSHSFFIYFFLVVSISSSASAFLFLLLFSPHKHPIHYTTTAFIKASEQFLIWRSTTKLSKISHRHLHRLPSSNRDTMKKRHRRSEPRTFTVKAHYFGHNSNCCQWVDCSSLWL